MPGHRARDAFVSFPFVAREIIPVMEATGLRKKRRRGCWARRVSDVFSRDAAEYQVGLLYGVILCNARAMGEFGAVSVVSGTSAG